MNPMIKLQTGLRRLSWLPIITGLISLGLGIWCLCSPTSSLEVFAYIFAGCICASGFLNVILGFTNVAFGWNWGWALAIGIIELICGIWMFTLSPAVLTSVFMFFIGIWIVVACINAICESFVMAVHSPIWTIFSILLLIAAVICAVIFLANPISGGVAIWLWIGISLILFGIYRLMFAAAIRSITKKF